MVTSNIRGGGTRNNSSTTPTHIKFRSPGKQRSSLVGSGSSPRRQRHGSPLASPERHTTPTRRDTKHSSKHNSASHTHTHAHSHTHATDHKIRSSDQIRSPTDNLRSYRVRRDPSPRDPPPDSDEESVCNYDTNVTTLYELLESSNWEKARGRCRTHPQEVRTWIVRRDEKNQRVRWKLLPLHAAVIFQSPTFVVSALMDNYPGAVSRRDDQGMLPLHLAFRYKEENEDLLELLLVQYPKGVFVKDKRDRTPLEHGRGSKFTSKLLKLYAEAAVSSATRSHMKNNSGAAGANLGEDDAATERRIAVITAEYENKTKTLKSMYEDRIKILHDKHQASMSQLRISLQDEKKTFQDRHEAEMEELRELMSSEVGKDGELITELQTEINQLRRDLGEARTDRDSTSLVCNEVKAYIDDLQAQIRNLIEDQESLQMLVQTQQQELDTAHDRREQLIQSLLREEQEDRNNRSRRENEMFALVESLRNRVEKSLQTTSNDIFSRHNSRMGSVGVDHLAGNEIGVGTTNPVGNNNPLGSSNQLVGGAADLVGGNPLVGEGLLGGADNTLGANIVGGGGTMGYGSGRAPLRFLAQMKDDISAITDNSNF